MSNDGLNTIKNFNIGRITYGTPRPYLNSAAATYVLEDRVAELEAQVEKLNTTLLAICELFKRLEPPEKP